MHFQGNVNEVFPWKENEKNSCFIIEIDLNIREDDDIYQMTTKTKDEVIAFERYEEAIDYIQQLIDNSNRYDPEMRWMFIGISSSAKKSPTIRFIGRNVNNSVKDIMYTIRICKIKFIRGESDE